MCGRYKQLSALQDFLGLDGLQPISTEAAPATGNITAPAQKAPVLRHIDGTPVLAMLDWGFVPHWAKEDMGAKIINARAETLHEKPAFREALRKRRCIVPMSAFFEWDRSLKPAQAYEISLTSGAPLAVAGVWECWINPKDRTRKESFAIATTAATPAIAPIHDRMPVLLQDARACALWLSQETDMNCVQALLRPAESAMTLTPVVVPPARVVSTQTAAQLALF